MTDTPHPADAPVGNAAAQFQAAEARFKERDYERAMAEFETAAGTAEAESDARVFVEASAMVARGHSIARDLEAGRPWLERAARRATPEEPYGWSRLLTVRGIFERDGGEKDRARSTFLELVDYCEANALGARAVDGMHHLALISGPEEQIEWNRRGIAAAHAAGEERWLAVLWNNLGYTFEDLERYPEMLEAYREARVWHDKTGTELNRLIAEWAVGHGLRLNGRAAEARESLSGALEWAERLYAEEPEPRYAEWVGYTLQELGELAADEDERSAAVVRLRAAREKLVEGGVGADWLETLDARIQALATGDDPGDAGSD